MRDLFLLLSAPTSLKTVGELALEAGCQTFAVGRDGKAGSIRLDDERIFELQLYEEGDFEAFDAEDLATLTERGVTCVIGVSLRRESIDVLIEIARRLLVAGHGWIGSDDDGFAPIFGLEELSEFKKVWLTS